MFSERSPSVFCTSHSCSALERLPRLLIMRLGLVFGLPSCVHGGVPHRCWGENLIPCAGTVVFAVYGQYLGY